MDCHIGIITFSSGKGWYFAENLSDHSSTFVHQNQVENQRYLRVDDRISFDLAPSPKAPGKLMAVNVKYLGHIVAAQYGDQGGAL
jgi:cold shock CspA family protein